MKYLPFSPRGVFLGSRTGGAPSGSRNLGGAGGGVVPYLGYIGMCRAKGYLF